MQDKLLKIKIFFTRYLFFIDYTDWKEQVWQSNLDDFVCCNGNMCCCNGETYRENYKR